MEKIVERLAKLIDVKSIITIVLTAVFAFATDKGAIPPDFLTIYTVVIAFYFGTQANRKSD